MKKIIPSLVAIIMAVSLTACGGSNSFSRGVIKDNIYTNKYAGVTYTAPEGYAYYSDEQIAALYGTTADVLNSEELDTIVYDLYCGNSESGGTVTITYENLVNIYGSVISDDSYLTLSLASVKTSFESLDGVTITAMDKNTINLDGTEYNGANIALDIGGNPFYETIIVKEIGGYMMCCTAASYNEAELDVILAGLDIAE